MAAENYWQGDVSTDPTVAGNWSTGAVPAVGEHLVFDDSATANCAGGNVSANQVASVRRMSTCTIAVGTDRANPLIIDCAGPVDDRGAGEAYWQIDNTTSWHYTGSGSKIFIDGTDNDYLLIDNSSATVTVGPINDTPAEFDIIQVNAGTVRINRAQSKAAGAMLELTVYGGAVETLDAIVATDVHGGTVTVSLDTSASIWVHGGTVKYNSATAIATMVYVYDGGTFTLEEGVDPVTIADAHIFAGGTFLDPNSRATFTAPPELHGCSLRDVTVDFGKHKQYTVAAI